VVLSSEDGSGLKWQFPIQGVAEAAPTGAGTVFRFETRARRRLEQIIEVNLAGLVPAGREEQYTHEAGSSLRTCTRPMLNRRAEPARVYGPAGKSCGHVRSRVESLFPMTLLRGGGGGGGSRGGAAGAERAAHAGGHHLGVGAPALRRDVHAAAGHEDHVRLHHRQGVGRPLALRGTACQMPPATSSTCILTLVC